MGAKKKTINVKEPWNAEICSESDGFALEVRDKKKVVRIHFKRWWVSILTGKLWGYMKDEKELVEALIRKMKEASDA